MGFPIGCCYFCMIIQGTMNALIIGKNTIVKHAIGGLLENEFDFNIDYINISKPQLSNYEY